MPVSRNWARQELARNNKGEYREIILASQDWDDRVASIVSRYRHPFVVRHTYRQVCRQISWEYRLSYYARFTQTRPSLWRALRTYPAWRRFLVKAFIRDQEQNRFCGPDTGQNRSPETAQRQAHLRSLQLAALKAELAELMDRETPYDHLRIRCSVAVVCRSQSDRHGGGCEFTFADIIGLAGLAPIRRAAERVAQK